MQAKAAVLIFRYLVILGTVQPSLHLRTLWALLFVDWKDPVGGLQYRSGTFYELAVRLKQLAKAVCGGRLVFLLEGGYDLEALGESVASTFSGILDGRVIDGIDPGLLRDEPVDKVKAVLEECRRIHGL